jgi:hypothetical protein
VNRRARNSAEAPTSRMGRWLENDSREEPNEQIPRLTRTLFGHEGFGQFADCLPKAWIPSEGGGRTFAGT